MRRLRILFGELLLFFALGMGAFSFPGFGEELPASVDLRPKLAEFRMEARPQGNRNTCSVFTLTGALQFAAAKREGSCPQLSVEFLNWAANQECGREQDGGFFSDMWKGFAAHGICAETNLPYKSAFDAGVLASPAAQLDAKARRDLGLRIHWIKEWDVKTGLTEAHIARIKATLNRGWPVAGGFRWPMQERRVGNVIQLCGPEAVRDGHSVLIIGYRDDAAKEGSERRTGNFIFRNSGGPVGDEGMMPYEYAREYMNDAVWIE